MAMESLNPFYGYSPYVQGGSYKPQTGAPVQPRVSEQSQSQKSAFLKKAQELPLEEQINLLYENEDFLNAINGEYDVESPKASKSSNPFAFDLQAARKMSPEYSPSIVDADFRTDSDFSEKYPEGLCC